MINNGKTFPKSGKVKKKDPYQKKRLLCPANRKKVVVQQKVCQCCGGSDNLSAHHIFFKSHGIDDSFSNLITLCFACHRKAHDGYYVEAEFVSPKEFIIFVLERLHYEVYILTLERLKNEI